MFLSYSLSRRPSPSSLFFLFFLLCPVTSLFLAAQAFFFIFRSFFFLSPQILTSSARNLSQSRYSVFSSQFFLAQPTHCPSSQPQPPTPILSISHFLFLFSRHPHSFSGFLPSFLSAVIHPLNPCCIFFLNSPTLGGTMRMKPLFHLFLEPFDGS